MKTADSTSAFHHLDAGQVVLTGPDGVFKSVREKIRKWNIQFCGGRSQNPKYWKLFLSSYDFQDILVLPANETGPI